MNLVGHLYMTSAVVYAYATTQVVVDCNAAVSDMIADKDDFIVVVGGVAATIASIAQSSIMTNPGKITLTIPSVAAGEVMPLSP